MNLEYINNILMTSENVSSTQQAAKLGSLTPPYTNLGKFAWFCNRTYMVYRMLDILELGLISQKLIPESSASPVHALMSQITSKNDLTSAWYMTRFLLH